MPDVTSSNVLTNTFAVSSCGSYVFGVASSVNDRRHAPYVAAVGKNEDSPPAPLLHYFSYYCANREVEPLRSAYHVFDD